MSIEAVKAVIDLIEIGAMATNEDIVKCLRSAIATAVAEPHKQEPKREPLTDEQFLELLLRKGSTELVGYSTFVSNSIQMQGRTGLLQGAKLLKEFVEAAHGINASEAEDSAKGKA